MMHNALRSIRHSDGSLQNIQIVTLEQWDDLSFSLPVVSFDAFRQVSALYRDYMVSYYGKALGTCVLFRLPDKPLPSFEKADNQSALSACASILRNGVRYGRNGLRFRTDEAKQLYAYLRQNDCLSVSSGSLPFCSILPVSDTLGFLSETAPESALRVNASFFTMNPFDIASVYDAIGTPIGLCVKNGEILNPPLFQREALLVDEHGTVSIRFLSLDELTFECGTATYVPNQNCTIFARPDHRRTVSGGYDTVIIGTTVTAFSDRPVSVPSSGFVLHTDHRPNVQIGEHIRIHGLEWVRFGIQAGNSAILDGTPVTRFRSSFSNLLNPFSTPVPPTFYPLHYRTDRAPRILLGEDCEHHPAIVWIEGAGKFGYEKGLESSGASLLESAYIAESLGLTNAVHLDGGGSAQILLSGKRYLHLSDRDPHTFIEQERAVAMALTAG